jgi:hypothetical protein
MLPKENPASAFLQLLTNQRIVGGIGNLFF